MYRLVLALIIVIGIIAKGYCNVPPPQQGYGNYNPNANYNNYQQQPPPSPHDQQPQQQQPPQYDPNTNMYGPPYGQGPPPPMGPPGQGSPPRYPPYPPSSSSSYPPQRPQYPPQKQQGAPGEGLFSKLKSSIIAAGAAIAGNDNDNDDYMRKVNNPYEQRLVPSGYQGMQRPPPPPQEGPSFFGKIKNFFGDNNGPPPQGNMKPVNRPNPNTNTNTNTFRMPGQTGGFGVHHHHHQQPPNPNTYTNTNTNTNTNDEFNSYYDPNTNTNTNTNTNDNNYFNPNTNTNTNTNTNIYDDMRFNTNTNTNTNTNNPYEYPPVLPPVPEPETANDPKLVQIGDCVVLILKPKEFFRKKGLLTAGGPTSFQIFADFEKVMTKFRANNDDDRAYGSAELLESSGVLSVNAVSGLTAINMEYENVDMDDSHYEELTAKCQDVIARDGSLHISMVPAATKSLLEKIPLREGWKETLALLTDKSIPMYIFSSGYGDVVAQTLLLNGISQGHHHRHQGPPALPQNVRIISNFFRTAPDGSVRAFSQPIVHERNKNATTAIRSMGMPIPDRPYAIIIGSHEDDTLMTNGLGTVPSTYLSSSSSSSSSSSTTLKETIKIGFLELCQNLPERLGTFLNAYDAVVIGDGSFQYIKTMLEEILGTEAPKERGRFSLFEKVSSGVDIF